MTKEELRARQAPLKEQYTNDPQEALLTLKAEGRVGEGISCRVDLGQAIAQAGLHKATGGTGLEVCSGDMLLQALVACAGVTLKAVATALAIDITSGTVIAEGDLDFRGTLGVSKEVPVGFKSIRLMFDLQTHAAEDQLALLLKLTERYCVVYQTLAGNPKMHASIGSR